jgi:hypothetical protein
VTKSARLALAALALSACGGDPGSAPSAVTVSSGSASQVSFDVVSGETNAPVAGARVVVAGAEYTTNAQGQVTVPGTVEPGALVDVVATGFFDRQTLLSRRGSDNRFTVWPRESPTGLTEFFTSEVVYTTAATGAPVVPGGVALSRWAANVSQVDVVYFGPGDGPGYRPFSDRALETQRAAVDELTNASGGRVVYNHPIPMGTPTRPGAGRVDLRIDPNMPVCLSSPDIWGVASLVEGAFTNAQVTYCHERASENLGLSVHELGHTFGLRHSSDASDVMNAFGRLVEVPSERERLVMTLMLQRSAGNRFPDNDRSAQAAAAEPREIGCRP